MRWIPRIAAFTAALIFGAFAASLFVTCPNNIVNDLAVINTDDVGPYRLLSAKDLSSSRWKGSWGYNSGDCTIEISQVAGDSFHGKLRKEGAEILIEGAFDPWTRMVTFNETKVVRLGAEMNEWSLGENRGRISRDGRIMYGTGVDEWGQYAWAVSSR